MNEREKQINPSLFYVIIFIISTFTEIIALEHGKFNLSVTELQLCKGPKTKNCTTSDVALYNNRALKFDTTVHSPVKLTNSKVLVLNNGKPYLRFHMDNPCNHLFLKPIFKAFLNISDNCIIPKGVFRYKIDILDVAMNYFADEFIYGNFTFKSTFFSRDCNFMCCKLDVTTFPRTKR